MHIPHILRGKVVLFALPLFVLSACASISDPESSIGDFIEPGADEAAPRVTNFGNIGVYITSAQTPTLAQVLTRPDGAAQSEAMAAVIDKLRNATPEELRNNPPPELDALAPHELFALQKAIYGRLYAQVRMRPEGNGSPEATAAAPRIVSCEKGASGIGGFLAAIVGYRKSTTATLTVTIAPDLASVRDDSGANDFVTNFPVLLVKRNKKGRRGFNCEYELNDDAPLTPQIYPETNDSLFFKFQVHHAKDQSVDFSTTLGLLSSIGALATPSKGFTRNVAAITSAELDTQINSFMGFFSSDVQATTTRMIKLSPDATNPFDKLVFSLAPPSGADSFETLTFDSGQAIAFELQYYPTLFAECGGYVSLAKCQIDFANDDEIVGKLYAVNPQSTLLDISNKAPEGTIGARSLASEMIDTHGLPEAEAQEKIGAVCRKLTAEQTFKPIAALNTIDRLIFRYVWLTALNGDFKTNRRLHSPACFTPQEEADLKSLSLNRPRERFPFPEFALDVDGRVKRTLNAISPLLRLEGLSGKEQLFGDSGLLQINLRALAEKADGTQLRPDVSRGADAAKTLDSIKFVGGPACRQTAIDLASGRETDTLFGFLNILRDTAPGGLADPNGGATASSGELFAPIVVELAAGSTLESPAIKSMTIPSSISQYLDALNSTISPEQFWNQSCFDDLTTPEQRAALTKMREFMGASQ